MSDGMEMRTGGAAAPPRRRTFWSGMVDRLFGYDFFLSYGHGDGDAYPLGLVEKLTARGYSVFIDKTEFAPGMKLDAATERRVRMTKHLVVIGRPHALSSKWVAREVEVFTSRPRGRDRAPILINIDQSVQAARDSSAVARQALDEDWLRIEEDLDGAADAGPTDGAVGQLIRAFEGLRVETRRARFFKRLAVFFAAVAAIAVWQAIEADRARDRAERNFAAALGGVDTLIQQLAGAIKFVERAPAEATAEIVAGAEGTLAALDAAGGDPRVALRLADANSALGLMAKRIGRFDDAERFGRAALEHLATPGVQAADPAGFRRTAALAELRLGETYSARGDRARALTHLRRAEAIARFPTAPDTPEDRFVHSIAATALMEAGTAQLNRTRAGAEVAAEAYRAAERIARELMALEPKSTVFQNDLALALMSRAQIDPTAAGPLTEEALALTEAMLRAEPDNIEWRRQRANALEAAIRAQMRDQPDLDAALAQRRMLVRERRRIVDSDPANASFRSGLGRAMRDLARLAASAGDADTAAAARREWIGVYAALVHDRADAAYWWARQLAAAIAADLAAGGPRAGDTERLAAALASAFADCPASDAIRALAAAQARTTRPAAPEVAASTSRSGHLGLDWSDPGAIADSLGPAGASPLPAHIRSACALAPKGG